MAFPETIGTSVTPRNVVAIALGGIVGLLLLAAGLVMDLPWLFPAVAAGGVFLWAIIRYPMFWLGTFFAGLPFFLTDSSEGLSAQELVMGAYLYGSVIVWLLWRVVRPGPPLVRGWPDFLLLTFLLLSVGNLGIALANDVDPVSWVAEWSLFLLMLYYFPLRDYGATTSGLRTIIFMAATSSALQALYSAYLYKQRLAESFVYAFQLTSARSALLGPVFLLALLSCVIGLFYARHRSTKILLSLVAVVNGAALILTFTRTLWVFFFVCSAISMLFLPPRKSVTFVLSLAAAATIVVGSIAAYSPRLAGIVTTMIANRLTSSSQLSGGDHSFETRVVEAEAAYHQIARYPLGGNGIRSTFVAWHPVNGYTNRATFVHIGYVGMAFKLGIPLGLLFVGMILSFTGRSIGTVINLRARTVDPTIKAMAIAMMVYMPALYVNIFMAGFFDQRYGNVMFAVIFAFVSIAYERTHRQAPAPLPVPAP